MALEVPEALEKSQTEAVVEAEEEAEEAQGHLDPAGPTQYPESPLVWEPLTSWAHPWCAEMNSPLQHSSTSSVPLLAADCEILEVEVDFLNVECR